MAEAVRKEGGKEGGGQGGGERGRVGYTEKKEEVSK